MHQHLPLCLTCNQAMEPGYLVDHGHGAVYPAAWIAGIPKWSRWLGLKIKGKTKVPVATFCCPQCGRLDSFAQPGNWPG
jgi:hypothetical protein